MNCGFVVGGNEVLGEFFLPEPGELHEEPVDVGHRTVEVPGDGVHLRAVAGREDCHLCHVRARSEATEGFRNLRGRKGHALEDAERGATVLEAGDEYRSRARRLRTTGLTGGRRAVDRTPEKRIVTGRNEGLAHVRDASPVALEASVLRTWVKDS